MSVSRRETGALPKPGALRGAGQIAVSAALVAKNLANKVPGAQLATLVPP